MPMLAALQLNMPKDIGYHLNEPVISKLKNNKQKNIPYT